MTFVPASSSSLGSPSGAAGGDLTGNYPTPTIGAKKVTAGDLNSGAATAGQVATADGAAGVAYAAVFPQQSTAGNDLTVLENSTGSALISGGDDSGGMRLRSPDGNTQLTVENGGIIASTGASGLAVTLTTIGGDCVTCNNSGANPTLGFFGHAGVVQPAAPVTLGNVIAGLQALGLFAT